MFLNSHLLLETERVCDRVGILAGGRVVREGELETLCAAADRWRVRFASGADAAALAAAGFVRGEEEGLFHIAAPTVAELNARIDRARASGALLAEVARDLRDLEERGGSALVIEANALRYSPVGELLLRCLNADDALSDVQRATGIDRLSDLDRVAVAGEVVVASGHFQKVRWEGGEGSGERPGRRYGERATIYGNGTKEVFGVWNGELMFFSDGASEIERAIDRLEGRAPPGQAIAEEMTYGELYGVLGAKDVARLLSGADSTLAEKVRRAAEWVELHLDAASDVGLVVRLHGGDAELVEDLGKALGAAMAVARAQARAEGEPALAELMDLARVTPGAYELTVELALPLRFFQEGLRCGREVDPLP